MKITIDSGEYIVRYFHRQLNGPKTQLDHLNDLPLMVRAACRDKQIKPYEGRTHFFPTVTGVTVCQLESEPGNVIATGYAFCSFKDQFNKRIGRQISLNRAVSGARRYSEALLRLLDEPERPY